MEKDKHALWKWLILIGMVAFSLVVVTPPKKKIQLGLDLQGGTSFTVQIDRARLADEIRSRSKEIAAEDVNRKVEDVLRDSRDRTLEVLRNRIDNLGIAEPNISSKGDRFIIQLPGIDDRKRQEAENSIKSAAYLEFRMVAERNAELVAALFDAGKAPEGYDIDSVDGRKSYVRTSEPLPTGDAFETYRRNLSKFNVPSAEYEFMLERRDETDGRVVYTPYFVERRAKLTGDNLKSAGVDFGQIGQPIVSLRFDGKGAAKFADITSDFGPNGARNQNNPTGRQLAIVLDDRLYSAPRIDEPILSGAAIIRGSFTIEEANLLSNILSAGSLPAPIKILETRSVEPTLGRASIRNGVKAILYGGIGVLIFMGVYYMFCGVIADVALLLNLILLPLGMIIAAGFLGIFAGEGGGGSVIKLPVLTLPGIAGILLTIGMAVDANVLIFERIREEVRSGKRLWSAVVAGYDRAFVTILDANLTTLLTGVILFIFGQGPIRGFAVTLCAGIMMSMFTALVVTKLFFSTVAGKLSMKALKMLSVIGETSVDFVGKRKMAAIGSLAVIAITWGILVVSGVKNPSAVFGVDFTGGSAVTFTFDQGKRLDVDSLRDTLAKAGVQESQIQYQKNLQDGSEWLEIKTGSDEIQYEGKDVKPVEIVRSVLPETFPEANLVVAMTDDVGPQIGKELKKSAVWAIICALVGIIIYISVRFEFGFALGAIVALTHDVLVAVGLFTLFGRQLSLPVVAALLTIVGYSVNDTIVVFDRIREDLRLIRDKNFKEICNLSINQTLSRTLLTSITTLITVVMLLLFGGGAIFDFALTLCIGVIVGTYSSIFVATPVVLLWHKDRKPEFAVKPVK